MVALVLTVFGAAFFTVFEEGGVGGVLPAGGIGAGAGVTHGLEELWEVTLNAGEAAG